MGEEKTTLEVIAPTPEEAIEKGLEQLGLSEDMVEIEILDAGSRGLLGIGGRQARVRITIKTFESLIDEHKPKITDIEREEQVDSDLSSQAVEIDFPISAQTNNRTSKPCNPSWSSCLSACA